MKKIVSVEGKEIEIDIDDPSLIEEIAKLQKEIYEMKEENKKHFEESKINIPKEEKASSTLEKIINFLRGTDNE